MSDFSGATETRLGMSMAEAGLWKILPIIICVKHKWCKPQDSGITQ